MANEKKESKIKVEDLPVPEQELSTEEAEAVTGGGFPMFHQALATNDTIKASAEGWAGIGAEANVASKPPKG